MRAKHACPRCGWSDTRPSAKHGFADRIAWAFALEPFRCLKCRTRFFRFVNRRAKVALVMGTIALFALLITVYVANRVAP
jgi:hypothetical protein